MDAKTHAQGFYTSKNNIDKSEWGAPGTTARFTEEEAAKMTARQLRPVQEASHAWG